MAEFMRELQAGEEAEVTRLLDAAFGGQDESRLVAALRKRGAMAGEQVVAEDGRIVGYLALSQMKAPKGWLCLAPVAVLPETQGRGIGRRMCGMIAAWAAAAGQTIVVLGEPDLYRRAGFSSERAAKLTSPYPISHTLLAGPGSDSPAKELIYPDAFGAA